MVSLEHHVRNVYDKIADVYYRKRKDGSLFINEYVEMPATLSLLKNVKNKEILDLGCGPGIYAEILERRGGRVSGIDISSRMIELAKSNAKNVDFKVGTVYKLPYKSSSFDIVLSTFVVEHFERLDNAFQEVNRVLKKGGTFIFSIYNPVLDATYPIKGNNLEGFLSDKNRRFEDYYREGLHKQIWWKGTKDEIEIIHVCRTYQTWIKTAIKNGFDIVDYLDAQPIPMSKKINKNEFGFASKVPLVCVFKTKKR